MREREQKGIKSRPSYKVLPERHDKLFPRMGEATNARRPYSQIKSEQEREVGWGCRTIKENTRRENINKEQGHKNHPSCGTECEEETEEKAMRWVRVKANRLVPLTYEQLKDRRKIL